MILMKKIHLKFLAVVLGACFLLAVMPVSAVKTAEQSVGGSLTRGSRFTVTITGLPNSTYYVWIAHTSTMTGEPRDQPPVIAGSQVDVMEDPPEGPWPIGSYQYNNGNGQTIRDDIPPSTSDMPNTRYYGLVTTDHSGQATVEFITSVNTGLRSYSVKVENPGSIDSDTLLVELQVYSRKAPASIEIFTTPQPEFFTVLPTTTGTPLPITTRLITTLPTTVQTPLPTLVPTQKAPLSVGTGILAAGLCFLLVRRH
jgi:hypothetical protein